MIKDTLFKSLLIPLLGFVIPVSSGLIHVQDFSTNQLIISNVIFIITSYIVWQGAIRIISLIRLQPWLKKNIFFKLFTICVAAAAYGALVIMISAVLWQMAFLIDVKWKPVLHAGILGAGSVVFLTLIYEAVFLSKERELDYKVLSQLDKERIYAELNSLRKEIDPHFLFNALTSLSHLVRNDSEKAYQFIQKLSSVYKYFLINKDKDFVRLEDELDFIDNYYFLLKIRYDENVKIVISVSHYDETLTILPFTLQTLVENAIKHNFFSDTDPLTIYIVIENACISVFNRIKPKPYAADSTKVGLKNLKARYKLISNKDVNIQTNRNRFIVKLPLVKQN